MRHIRWRVCAVCVAVCLCCACRGSWAAGCLRNVVKYLSVIWRILFFLANTFSDHRYGVPHIVLLGFPVKSIYMELGDVFMLCMLLRVILHVEVFELLCVCAWCFSHQAVRTGRHGQNVSMSSSSVTRFCIYRPMFACARMSRVARFRVRTSPSLSLSQDFWGPSRILVVWICVSKVPYYAFVYSSAFFLQLCSRKMCLLLLCM